MRSRQITMTCKLYFLAFLWQPWRWTGRYAKMLTFWARLGHFSCQPGRIQWPSSRISSWSSLSPALNEANEWSLFWQDVVLLSSASQSASGESGSDQAEWAALIGWEKSEQKIRQKLEQQLKWMEFRAQPKFHDVGFKVSRLSDKTDCHIPTNVQKTVISSRRKLCGNAQERKSPLRDPESGLWRMKSEISNLFDNPSTLNLERGEEVVFSKRMEKWTRNWKKICFCCLWIRACRPFCLFMQI